MGDRDSRVIYKTRILDKDEERPRVPTALDPYGSPYPGLPSGRRNYGPRDSGSSLDDTSTITPAGRSTARTTYSVRDDTRPKDVYVDPRRSSRTDGPPLDDVSSRRSVAVDQRRDEHPARRSEVPIDRGYGGANVERPRERGREYYVDDRPRPIGAPYVIDARSGDIIDISVPGRGGDRGYDRGTRRYVYDDPRSSRNSQYDRERDSGQSISRSEDVRRGNTVVIDRDYPPSQERYPYDDRRPAQPSGREYNYDREEEWRLVDTMRDTRIDSAQPRDTRSTQVVRSRAPTQSSEDSYVMVSPTQAPRSRETSSMRSALRRGDYPDQELRRRRSRSISFRESQTAYHDCSERKHERPGAEAEMCGPYLRNVVLPSDDGTETYVSRRQETDSRSRGRDRDAYNPVRYERDEPYPPQQDDEPKKRDRSRRRRRREVDNDDGSYYSENVVKTTRETKYR